MKSRWFKYNGGQIDDLIPLMCPIGEVCLRNYIVAALKILNDKNLAKHVRATLLPRLEILFEHHCFSDPAIDDEFSGDDYLPETPEEDASEITINIRGETIPLNMLRGDKLREVLKGINKKDLESLMEFNLNVESRTKIIVK